jgi:hypothetical protein
LGEPLQAVAFGRELLQPLVNVKKPRLTAHLRPPAQTSRIESQTRQNREVFGGLQISNNGKTPGELYEIGVGWCEAFSVPENPNYTRIYFREWIGPGTQNRPLQQYGIPQNFSYPAIYGRVYYRDIFNEEHSSGFILALDLNGASPVLAPQVYTSSD